MSAAAGPVPDTCHRGPPTSLTCFPILFPEAEPLGTDALAAAAVGVLRPLLSRGRERRLRELDVRLRRAAKARERHRDGLRKQLGNCAEAEMLRRRGELLLSHLGDVPPRAESVTLTDWEGNTLEIALDPRLSPSHNADRYFRRYRKAKADPESIRRSTAVDRKSVV